MRGNKGEVWNRVNSLDWEGKIRVKGGKVTRELITEGKRRGREGKIRKIKEKYEVKQRGKEGI